MAGRIPGYVLCFPYYVCIGKCKRGIILMQCVCTADGAAAVEALREELTLAKEQARVSNADALKAAEELRAEQVAHR